jgi:hypothetical protein
MLPLYYTHWPVGLGYQHGQTQLTNNDGGEKGQLQLLPAYRTLACIKTSKMIH